MLASRRHLTSSLGAALGTLALGVVAPAFASSYPRKPLTIVVPTPAGTSPDGLARFIAPRLSRVLGHPVIVENRPGAGSTIATTHVARRPADGHTLLLVGSSFTVNATLLKRYDPKQFTPVALIAESPLLIASSANSRIHTLQDFIQAARAKPESVSYGSFGIGTSSHAVMEQIAACTGTRFLHVPFAGITRSLPELLAGHIDIALGVQESMMPMIKDGRLRPLAIVGSRRAPSMPDVPTLAQAGVPADLPIIWQGLVVRAGTSPTTVARLNQVINDIVGAPEVRRMLAARDMQVMLYQPTALQKLVDEDVRKWAAIIRKANIQPE